MELTIEEIPQPTDRRETTRLGYTTDRDLR